MAFNLPIGYQTTMAAKWLDANNNPLVGITGLSVWTNDNPAVANLSVSTGNTYATIYSLGVFGSANVTVTLGTLSLTEEFIIASPANGTLSFGKAIPASAAVGSV